MTPQDHIDLSETPQKAKVYKASNELQRKAGIGQVDQKTIDKAENIITNANIDFVPAATEYLRNLNTVLQNAKKGKYSEHPHKLRHALTKPIMALKAESAMFGYDLVGDLANIMLNFLETVKIVDNTVIKIIEAHHTTLHVVIAKKLSGNGGPAGEALKKELKKVITKYQQKDKK